MLDGLPRGHYRAIVADPPWHFSTWSAKGRGRCHDAPVYDERGFDTRGRNNSPSRHYATMTLDEIKALPIGDFAARDCLLFLWAVDPMLPQVFEVASAWGFTYKTVGFYWVKERRNGGANNKRPHVKHRPYPMGTGYWTRANPEQCLLFGRGSPKRLATDVEKLIISERREHSRKPDEALDAIERLVDGPYLELFARRRRSGWDAWGDQLPPSSIEDLFG